MKKEGLILLALVLVFGFVVLGCGSTSELPIPPPRVDPEWINDLGEFKLNFEPNFQYGKGYQGLMSSHTDPASKASEVFKGETIKAGDKYKLEIEFTLSRVWDATKDTDFQVGLVDRDASVDYWKELSKPEEIDVAELNEATSHVYKYEFIFTATDAAGGAEVSRNDLFFQFESNRETHEQELNPGANETAAAVAGKITMDFKKFVFTKL